MVLSFKFVPLDFHTLFSSSIVKRQLIHPPFVQSKERCYGIHCSFFATTLYKLSAFVTTIDRLLMVIP